MNKRILVVDDDLAILEAVQLILEDYGYDVVTRDRGITILQDIRKYRPDLLLLDLWLPAVDGNQITKKLKTNRKTQNLPIILFSASNEVEPIAKAAGADAFLAKPFNIDDLIWLIEKYTT